MSSNQKPAPKVPDSPETLRTKRIRGLVYLGVLIVVLVVLTFVVGRPLVSMIRNKTGFRQYMNSLGFMKYPMMIGIMALQVIVALIPGEPIEIAAGYIFGPWGGLILCLLGCALGSVLIILAVRTFGIRFVELFFKREQIENLRFFKDPKKRDAMVFLLFLIPGTPKDVLTYLAGLVPIHMGKFILLTSVARIPSIITSTAGGNLLGEKRYKEAALVFVVTLLVTGVLALLYRQYQNRKTTKALLKEADKVAMEGETLNEDNATNETLSAGETADKPEELKKDQNDVPIG